MILGIDVSKDKFDVIILPEKSHFIFKNSEKGVHQLVSKLKRLQVNIELIALEDTGGYEKLLVKMLSDANYPIHIAQGKRIHYFAKAQGYLGKTDKQDAMVIAKYASQNDIEPNASAYLKDIELRELQSRLNQVEKLLTSEKNKLDKGLLSKDAIRSIKRMIRLLEKEKEILNEKISKILVTDEEKQKVMEQLKTVKGVGDGLARTLVIFLPELGHRNRAKIAALAGVAPINNDSGKKQGYRKTVGGRGAIKQALFMAALSASRFNETLRVYYQRLLGKGKKKKVALMAVMLNAMQRDKIGWREAEVG